MWPAAGDHAEGARSPTANEWPAGWLSSDDEAGTVTMLMGVSGCFFSFGRPQLAAASMRDTAVRHDMVALTVCIQSPQTLMPRARGRVIEERHA